jgi:hypothetical protein
MSQQAFRVGECVTTPRGFVAEIAELVSDCALIRYLGKQRHLGEMEMKLALLRPATPHDMALAGILGGDPSAPKPWPPSAAPVPTPARRQPPRDEHNDLRSRRTGSAIEPHGGGLHELVTDLLKDSSEQARIPDAGYPRPSSSVARSGGG